MSHKTPATESPTQSTQASPTPSSGGSPAGAASTSGHAPLLRGMSYDAQVQKLTPAGATVQRKGDGADGGDVHAAAAHGISGGGGALPHGDAIQRSFGGYDISQVQAHTDSAAAAGSASMGADAYATGNHIAFGGAPDLHTAAHEAAHVVQQKAGVSLSGGVGQAGDAYEQHADAVADAVVQGKSAEPILAQMAGSPGGGGGVQQQAVQRKEEKQLEKTATVDTTTALPTAKPSTSLSPALAAHEKDVEELALLVDALERAGKNVRADFDKQVRGRLDELKAAMEVQAGLPAADKPSIPASKGAQGKPASDPAKLSAGFRTLCSTRKVHYTNQIKKVVEALSGTLARSEEGMTILLARYDRAIALSAEKRVVIEELKTDFEAEKLLHLAFATVMKAPTAEGLKAFDIAKNRTDLKAAQAKVTVNQTKAEGWLADYEKAIKAIDAYLNAFGEQVLASKKAALEARMKASQGGMMIVHEVTALTFGDEKEPNQRKRLEGVLSAGQTTGRLKLPAAQTDLSELVDMVGLTPELRASFVHWMHLDGNGPSDVAADTGSQLSPVHVLAEKMRSLTGAAAHEALAEFVRKWGTAKAVMDDARANANIASVIGTMKTKEPELAAVCNETLMTGKVVAFDPSSVKKVTVEQSDGSVTDGPFELRLQVLSLRETLTPELRVALASCCTELGTLYKKVKDAMAANTGVDATTYAAYSAFVGRVGSNASVIKMLKSNFSSTYENTFLPLVTMKVMSTEAVEAQKKRDEEEAAKASTQPVTTTPETPKLELGGDNAKRADVEEGNGKEPADQATTETLAKEHGDLGKGAAELFGHHEIVATGETAILVFLAPSASKIAGIVGSPPVAAKVRYVLDRFHEKNGLEFFRSKPFRDCSPSEQKAIKAALGITDDTTTPYAAQLGFMFEDLKALATLGAMDAQTLAFKIDIAMMAASEILAKIASVPDGTLDPAIAPSGRRPSTAAMIFLNAFRFKQGVDFLAQLRNVLNEKPWYKSQASAKAAIDAGGEGALSKVLKTHFGFEVKHVGESGEQKVDLAMGADAASAILGGDVEGRFVTKAMIEGKKVRDGFDDKTALRIADNIEGVLTTSKSAEKKVAAKDTDAKAGDIVSYSVLAGSMGGLLAVLGTAKADKQLMVAIMSLTFSERDAVDAAFRLRFGRTMKAALAEKGKADETEDFFELDANDAQAQAKWKLRLDAKRGAIKAVFEACATAAPDARKNWLSDTALLSDLAAHIPEMDELRSILAGDFDVYKAIAAKRGWVWGTVGNDKEGAKEDLDLFIKMKVADLKAKYPDATDISKPKHFEHKASFEAEHRDFFIRLATDPKLEEALRRVLSKSEVEVLLAKVIAGGKDDPKAAILKIWRDRGFFTGLDRKGIVAAIKGLSDDDRAIVAKDVEVRAVICQALEPKDQHVVFAVLAGDKNIAIEEMFVGKWWLTIKADEIYTHLLNMDFAGHQALKADEQTLLGLLEAVGSIQAPKIRKLLGLTEAGIVSTTPSDADLTTAAKKNAAQIAFYKTVLKERLLVAAAKGPNEAFTQASAIYKMNVTPASDTSTADAMKKDGSLDKHYQQGYVGDADNLLTMTVAAEKISVRQHLAADKAIAAALAECFGTKKPEYAKAVLDALGGKADPAPMMAEYHLRDKGSGLIGEVASSLVTNATGIKDAISAATDVTFLTQFTDVGKLTDLLVTYETHREAEKYAIDDAAKKTAADAKATVLKSIRSTRIEMAPTWRQRIEHSTSVQDQKPIDSAFRAKLIEALGADAVKNPSKVGAAAQALFVLSNGKVKLDANTITSVLAGADLEGRVKVDAAMEKQKQSSGGIDLFNTDNTDLLAETTGSIGNVANTSVAKEGVIDSDAVGQIDALNTAADEISKKIDARRDLITSAAQKAASFGIAALSNFLLPGAPLWAMVLIKTVTLVGGSAAKHGIKKIVHGSENYDMTKGVVLDVLADVVTNLVGSFTDLVSITKDGALKGGALDDYPKIKFIFEKEVQGLIAGTTGFFKDPVKMAEAYEKGWAFASTPIKNSWRSMTDASKVENAFKGKLDELIKKVIEKTLESGQELLSEALLGKEEEKSADTLAQTIDPTKDGKAVTRSEIEMLAGAGIVEKVEIAWDAAVASIGPTLMKHVPFPIGKSDEETAEHWKEWKKWAVKGSLPLLASALKQLPTLFDDPRQFIHDKNKAVAAFGFPIPSRDQNTFLKRFKVFKEGPFVGFIISKTMADGSTVLDAFNSAWARFSLASDLVEADQGNAGLLDDVVSADSIRINQAAGFLKTLETRKKTTVWDGYNETPTQQLPTYASYQLAFRELVASTKVPGGDTSVIEDAVAKFVASNESGLSALLPNSHKPGSEEAAAQIKAGAKLKQSVAEAAKAAVEADIKKKAAVTKT